MFPYYGGKTHAAPLIWEAMGHVPNYIEAFAGALGTLFQRPHPPGIETVNDIDAFICNVFRAIQHDPDGVTHWADFPVNEAQQHAVHSWLVQQRETFTAKIMGDPEFYDAKVAGYWLYGICCWIGGGWCSGNGPWQSVDGQLVHLGDAGQGIYRQRVHLGDAGQGIHRQRVHLGDAGRGEGLRDYMYAVAHRLERVRVCCGDWTRVLGPSVTFNHGLTGIVLDPPYSKEEQRQADLYAHDDLEVAHAVRAWCLAHGQHPLLRIVLCGYGTVHDELLTHGWRKRAWIANGGFGNQRKAKDYTNKYQEMLWLSPHCLQSDAEKQLRLV
jgi:site-specific DNA-adenine methylase